MEGGNDCQRVAGDGVRDTREKSKSSFVSGSLSWDTYVEEVLILKELEPGANDPVRNLGLLRMPNVSSKLSGQGRIGLPFISLW